MDVFGGEDAVISLPLRPRSRADPIRDSYASRILASHDGSARRRADLTRRVAIGEAHPGVRERIDVGRLVEG